ncbi:MAG TPA: hypothetical protein VGX16_03300, partial [Solirubrobacteraceae bacterium]|nr:hypothetical protein [Solirubrobacteraceae bacterium]
MASTHRRTKRGTIARRRKSTRGKRARASRRTRKTSAWWPQTPVLDERQRDVLALGMLALGVFLAFVIYGGWNGGRVGEWLTVALGWSVGRARGLAPVAFVLAGGAILTAPALPSVRPLRAGCACLFTATVLALAAGTFGVSAGETPGAPVGVQWSTEHLSARGGAAGEALYAVTHRLVQDVGVSILVVFLLLAGVILLSGASLATVLRATRGGLIDSTRMLRAQLGAAERRVRHERASTRAADVSGTAGRAEPPPPPTPPDPHAHELIVRATHVEAPAPVDAPPFEDFDPDRSELDLAPDGEPEGNLKE